MSDMLQPFGEIHNTQAMIQIHPADKLKHVGH